MTAEKRVLILAGPNGAGKTTFAREYLIHEADCPMFINADLIADGLSPFAPEKAALRAGRIMLRMRSRPLARVRALHSKRHWLAGTMRAISRHGDARAMWSNCTSWPCLPRKLPSRASPSECAKAVTTFLRMSFAADSRRA